MQQPAATTSAIAPQAITLCDGETIDGKTFCDHLARMLIGTATITGPTAALCFATQNKRS